MSIGLVLIVLVAAVLLWIRAGTYEPKSLAMEAQVSDPQVKVERIDEGLLFQPTEPVKEEAVVFYQGALVEEASYSYWARQLAAAGYPVYLLHHPLNLAVLSTVDVAEMVQEEGIAEYVVGGHSLGGVMASRYANEHLKDAGLKGVFYLASYPDEKGSLLSFEGKVLSVNGSNDGVVSQESSQNAKQWLPAQTVFKEIDGGNHAGFGDYGFQKGDQAATITNKEQQDQLVKLLLDWLSTN
ncbi:alpha/beta hydrolase [Pisciglobus halotolerans]|uniref:Alpha/beta hydrolase family protein n=1 Tax=Pisciglobus halotolerans TaxID=745365 RepID=A0A1I3AZ33_9LACT|nr:alpha/beta hydrolase [Pisciglobus halotolerans]SFH54661.1 Alpha/beta hydrolase family protein [Pisciglobus halotolerans]